MSTLARSDSHNGKKPQYKDYVSFLDSYRNPGKKDDQHGVVNSDSGVNFSLNGSANSSSSSVFSDVTDGSARNGFKHNFVQPKQNNKTVKTEMFIQINNNNPPPQSFATQVFEVKKVDRREESTLSVSNAAKIFENNTVTKQSSFRSGDVRKFEGASNINAKPPVKRAASIGEVSKIFEQPQQNGNTRTFNRKNFNAVPKPFQPSCRLPPPNPPKITTDIKIPKPVILSPKPVIVQAPSFPKFTPEPPRSYPESVDSALSSLSISPSPPQCASPPPGAPLSPPPPPPPLPPANFTSKTSNTRPSIQKQVTNNRQPVMSPNGTMDRNDPRVKKAVYGALRNMYGSYHDQANDYLATLPKNRVRKNNGLDSIIDSIASQGGLDKLSGRANPKLEVQ